MILPDFFGSRVQVYWKIFLVGGGKTTVMIERN